MLIVLVGTIRKVTAAFTMADGTHLPVGALVGVDTQHNVFTHSTLENPDVFDGFRFEKLRNAQNSDSKFQVCRHNPSAWLARLTTHRL